MQKPNASNAANVIPQALNIKIKLVLMSYYCKQFPSGDMNSIGWATISVPSSGNSRANVPMVTVIPRATIPTMCVVSFFMVISFSTFL